MGSTDDTVQMQGAGIPPSSLPKDTLQRTPQGERNSATERDVEADRRETSEEQRVDTRDGTQSSSGQRQVGIHCCRTKRQAAQRGLNK